MITSRYPFWRTNPAGFAVSGHWPILTGTLAVLIGPVILGTIIVGLSGLFSMPSTPGTQTAPVRMIELFGIMLVGSPVVSWIGLIFAIPISGIAATGGFAGWGVAAFGGFLAGLLMAFLEYGVALTIGSFGLGLIGLILALFYWGAIHFVHPTAIGVGFKSPRS